MSMDMSRLAHPKGDSVATVRKAKKKADAAEWRRVCRKVDKRDGRVCQVTGVKLEAFNDDPWRDLTRHHLEYRSQNRGRRNDWVNVWTVSRGVHELIHAKKLFVLDRNGDPAEDVREIYAVAWNRARVAQWEEPCSVMRKWFIASFQFGFAGRHSLGPPA